MPTARCTRATSPSTPIPRSATTFSWRALLGLHITGPFDEHYGVPIGILADAPAGLIAG